MAISNGEFDYVRTLVQQRAGILLEPGKEYLVEARLDPLAQREGYANIQELLAELRDDPSDPLHHRIVEAMTTNETYFFRDVRPFDFLKATVLPDLISKRSVCRCLTFWCAASSSGQEPYSVAMLLKEHFPQLSTWNLRFIASDFSGEMLARAIQGRFTQLEVNRGLPAPLLIKYFEKIDREWEIREDLRRMIEFREMNLAGEWSILPPVDIIFMRNVLIYFGLETKREILQKARKILKPGGYLFLGSAETTFSVDDSFEAIPHERPVCHRVRESA